MTDAGIDQTKDSVVDLLRRVSLALVLLAVIFIPLIVVPAGKDSFRLPKLLLFHATGFIAVSMLLCWMIFARKVVIAVLRPSRSAVAVCGAAVVWAVITAVFSHNRGISSGSLITVVAAAAFFLLALLAAHRSRVLLAVAVALPAVVNAIVYLLQWSGSWNPFVPQEVRASLTDEEFRYLSEAALLGNRNDVGTFFVLPLVVLLWLAITHRGVGRALGLIIAAFIAFAIVVSQTLTAIASAAVALLVFGFSRSLRTGFALTVGAAALIAAAFLFFPPLRERAVTMRQNVETRQYDRLVTARLTPFVAAWAMGCDHPLFGLGPGMFAAAYFDYKIEVCDRYPVLLGSARENAVNWSETHNDYLQFFAEAGVPGSLIFAAALVVWGFSVRRRAAGLSSLTAPAAAALATLSLAQFPLQIAATLVTYLFVAATSIAWTAQEL